MGGRPFALLRDHAGRLRRVLGLARVLSKARPDAARPLVEIALAHESDPRKRREAHALAAHLALEQQQGRLALTHLRQAADPADEEATWALIARCVLESGVTDLAGMPSETASLHAVCAEALERSPADADLWSAAGGEALLRNDVESAIRHFEQATALAPDRTAFRNNLEAARSRRAE